MEGSIHFMRAAAPVLAPLFRSDTQARLLAELLLPAAEMNVSALAERLGIPYGTVHREVRRLLDAGILSERRVGNVRLIGGNSDSPLVAPVRQILSTVAGPTAILKEELAQIDGIEVAFIFGSFAARARGVSGPPPNDIDLMVVGDVDAHVVYRICRAASDVVGRTVNPTVMTTQEWSEQSGFLQEVRTNPVLEVIGDVSAWL